MPVSTIVLSNLGLIYFHVRGVVDHLQILAAHQETEHHPDFRPGMTELANMTDVSDINIKFPSMIGLRDRLSTRYSANETITQVHTLAPTDLTFGMARMYQTLAEIGNAKIRFHVHRSETETLAAMKRPESSISELLSGSLDTV